MSEPKAESVWARVWALLKKVSRYLLVALPVLLVVAVAIFLIVSGVKGVQIGGLLDKLLGRNRKGTAKAVDKANTIPPDRVDDKGNLIPIGNPDSKGLTQAKVVEIERPGIFDREDQVRVATGKEEVVVDLPEGVRAKDVDKVIVVKPKVFAVSVKDNSKVKAQDVDALLTKYGS